MQVGQIVVFVLLFYASVWDVPPSSVFQRTIIVLGQSFSFFFFKFFFLSKIAFFCGIKSKVVKLINQENKRKVKKLEESVLIVYSFKSKD